MERFYSFKQDPVSLTATECTGARVADLSNLALTQASYQYLSGRTLGRFVPNVFRVNPVTLTRVDLSSISDANFKLKWRNSCIPPREPRGWAYANGPIATVDVGSSAFSSNGYAFPGRNIPTWNTQLAALVTIGAFSKVNSPELLEGGVFFAELRESIAMLRNPFNGLVRMLTKKRFRTPRHLINAPSDVWMEFRYGVFPLANDIATIAALFNARAMKMESKIEVVRKHQTVISQNLWPVSNATVGSFSVKRRATSSFVDEYTIGVSYIPKPGIASFAHLMGLAPQDIPQVIWETIPLSFVVDWFYGVGPWLRAITPNPSITMLGSFISRKLSEKMTVTSCLHAYGNANYYSEGMPAVSSVSMKRLERRSGAALPALPVRKISTLKLAQEIDSLSLLWQRIPLAWRARR